MKRNDNRTLGIVSFILGILFLINYKLNITGAIVGNPSNISPINSINLVWGITLILVSVIIFSFKGNLEGSVNDVEEMELQHDNPVIIDTNFLIEVCKNPPEYKNLMRFIKERYDHGQPVIVPKSVHAEFKFMSRDEGEENRIKNLKGALAKYTTTLLHPTSILTTTGQGYTP